MAFRKVYGSDNSFNDEEDHDDMIKISKINTKKL